MTGKRVRSMKIILDYKPIKLLEKNREFFNQSVVSYKNSAVVAAYELTANQVRVFVQLNRGTKDPFNGIGIVLPEVGNGIVIRGKLFDEPHHFNVAPAFLLQDPGGTHPVQITIDEQFEQFSGGTFFSPRILDRPFSIKTDICDKLLNNVRSISKSIISCKPSVYKWFEMIDVKFLQISILLYILKTKRSNTYGIQF
jgi:hypothetical protein